MKKKNPNFWYSGSAGPFSLETRQLLCTAVNICRELVLSAGIRNAVLWMLLFCVCRVPVQTLSSYFGAVDILQTVAQQTLVQVLCSAVDDLILYADVVV